MLKLLDNDHYVSRYKVYEDGATVRDISSTCRDSINFFNAFLTMLIIDSTYKTNKYRLPLMEIVGVTSTKMIF